MHATRLYSVALFVAAASVASASIAGAPPYDEQRGYDQPGRGSWNSWYGPSRPGQNDNSGSWAIGTFYGKNGANGLDETITIRPDGSAELRTRDQPPKYGSFAGETLTFDSRISRVQRARGGIVVDGAYYNR